jgi:hypothetical protein
MAAGAAEPGGQGEKVRGDSGRIRGRFGGLQGHGDGETEFTEGEGNDLLDGDERDAGRGVQDEYRLPRSGAWSLRAVIRAGRIYRRVGG